jgi:cyclopropane fatty-acyl-phospholipid synthase-like methyltransferase
MPTGIAPGMKVLDVGSGAGDAVLLLAAPRLQFNTVMGAGADFAGYTFAAATLRSLLPVIERSGIATAAEIDVDTLPDRRRDEVVAADATITTISVVAAWSILPAAGAA